MQFKLYRRYGASSKSHKCQYPLGHITKPQKVLHGIWFLASDAASSKYPGVNLLANLQFRVFVSPFYQMARGVRGVDSRVQISFWMLAGESPVGTKEGPVP